MAPRKRKHQKTDQLDDPTAKCIIVADTATRLPLKLNDLNEDVLAEIFSYLNADELVTVVKLDKIFLCSCARAFQKKYKNVCIKLPLKELKCTTKMDYTKNAELLRYFGENMSQLQIETEEYNKTDQRIYHSIVTNCRETLTEIEFCFPSTAMKINKCFPKLKTLKIFRGTIHQSMCQFRKWFPMLENLFIDRVSNTGKTLSTCRSIESLKCFSLDFTDEESDDLDYAFHIQDLNRFIKCNPQLNELRLTLSDYDIDTGTRRRTERMELPDGAASDQLMTVKLNLPFEEWDTGHSHALADLTIANDRIEHLDMNCATLTPQICTFVVKCKNLKTLKLNLKIRLTLLDNADPFEVAAWMDSSKHELLTHFELTLCFINFGSGVSAVGLSSIRSFLKRCKSLNTFKVRWMTYSIAGLVLHFDQDFDAIRAQIDPKVWSLSYEILKDEVSFTFKKV